MSTVNHHEKLSIAVKVIIITVSLSGLKQLTAPFSFIAKGAIYCLSPLFPPYSYDLCYVTQCKVNLPQMHTLYVYAGVRDTL